MDNLEKMKVSLKYLLIVLVMGSIATGICLKRANDRVVINNNSNNTVNEAFISE